MTELNNYMEPPEQQFQLASLFGPEAAGASGLPGGKSLKGEFTKVTQPSPIAHELVASVATWRPSWKSIVGTTGCTPLT